MSSVAISYKIFGVYISPTSFILDFHFNYFSAYIYFFTIHDYTFL